MNAWARDKRVEKEVVKGVSDATPSTKNALLPFWRSNECLSFLLHRLREFPNNSVVVVDAVPRL